MFHVKHSRLVAIFAGLVLIGLLTGCGQVSKPSGWSAPVDAGDGVVVVHEKRGTLTALRVTDAGSAVLWRFPGDGDDRNYQGFYATPIVDRSGATPRLLAASYSGHVVSIDLSNGGLTAGWPEEVKVGGHVVATPALDGDALYVATSGGDVKPVSISTGVVGAAVVRAGDRLGGAPAVEGGVGYAGALHTRVCMVWDLPPRSCAFEFDLDLVVARASDYVAKGPKFHSMPVAKEDIALVVSAQTPASEVAQSLANGAGALLESIRLFDVYEGPQVGEGNKSLAFSLRFRAPDRTPSPRSCTATRAPRWRPGSRRRRPACRWSTWRRGSARTTRAGPSPRR